MSNYDYYKFFYYVAKYQNFTQAAAALQSNQPNVTRVIKNLEAELGCTLFVRSNRSVTLTPEGKKLFEHISIACEHIDAAEQELSLDRSLQQGTISIGASEVALHCLLLPVLKNFRQQYPGIRLKVSNHSTPQAIHALKNGLVDLAVITTPVDLSHELKMTELKSIQETAIGGPAFAHLAKSTPSLTDLCQYPLICLGQQTKTYALYSQWFRSHNLTLTPDIEAATADQILPMVRHDLGIGFIPEEFLPAAPEKEGIYPIKLKEEVPQRSICLVKHRERSLSIAAAKLEHMITVQTEDTV